MNNLKIEAKKLNKTFSGKQILFDIDLQIEDGKSHIIIGGSGSGKSVLIKSLTGLLEPDEGSSILINGEEILPYNEMKVNRFMANCGFLFQHGALFDSLPVWKNIGFRLMQHDKKPKKEVRDIAAQKLESVGLKPDILDLYPAELSGGMQKRVALARSIAHDPSIIFFDEPTTGLDPIMTSVINDLINKIKEELKATIVVITHEMKTVHKVADNVSMLVNGQIVWSGSKTEMDQSRNQTLLSFIEG